MTVPGEALKPAPSRLDGGEWVARLSAKGRVREGAIAELHDLMIRASRHQLGRMPDAGALGQARRDEIVHSAADEATVLVLAKLDTFEGRSAFTTWAFKFGIMQTLAEARRAVWRDRPLPLPEEFDVPQQIAQSPENHVEARDLAAAVKRAIAEALTVHQRRIATALLIDEVPIDVLADRLSTTRSALYKTLHDSRKRLRGYLVAAGFEIAA